MFLDKGAGETHGDGEGDVTNTIEWLEAIGSDAALRYATAGELTTVLQAARASTVLTEAIASGDRTVLFGEFGFRQMPVNHATLSPGHEDDEPDEGEGEEPRDPPPSPSSDERR